ncbi:lipase family protein [Marinomonas sp. THO17]|uniref:lipase family protein n=1 Tax=Marinomonas sp. THO17 TaxID=3149048 RepID=UPI00336C1CF7
MLISSKLARCFSYRRLTMLPRHLFIIFCLFNLLFLLPKAYAQINFKQLSQFAKLSSDTYIETLTKSELGDTLKQQGQQLIHQAVLPNSDVLYFLSQNKQAQTLAIRGTANLNNVILDLTVSLQFDQALGVQLHTGFAQAAQQVLQDVRPYLDKDIPLAITGHSLGGAIAVVLAMYLEAEGHPIESVVTFGQPKVTNLSGAKKFADMPLLRIVTEQDIVPLVPPISPLQIQNLDIFWHMGKEIILLGKHQFSVTSGIKSALRATKFSNQLPSEANLRAHQISRYIILLDALSTKEEEVPYRMEINLFGISID